MVGHPAARWFRASRAQYRNGAKHRCDRDIVFHKLDLRLPMGMRVEPTQTVPASVYRHLLPREDKVIAVRFHPAVLIGPAAIVLGGLAVAGLLTTSVAHSNGTAMLVIWGVWAILVGRLVIKFLNWY